MKLILGLLSIGKGTMNDHGYLDTCRDDLPVMDCVDLVARDACGAMTDIEQESCRVTCKTCQTSNCIDTLENDGCLALIRAHAVRLGCRSIMNLSKNLMWFLLNICKSSKSTSILI